MAQIKRSTLILNPTAPPPAAPAVAAVRTNLAARLICLAEVKVQGRVTHLLLRALRNPVVIKVEAGLAREAAAVRFLIRVAVNQALEAAAKELAVVLPVELVVVDLAAAVRVIKCFN